MSKNSNVFSKYLTAPMKKEGKPVPPKPGEKWQPLPEKSVWFTHDPAIYHDPVSNNYYIYGTGANALKSKDMIEWERMGKVVENPPKEAADWVGDTAIWAPDIVKVGDEYRLYCSNSTWGVRQSDIFLAVADNAEGPFIPRGIVIKTSEDLPVNAIDANIIEDVRTHKQYMTYGSFWGGIHIIELDKVTGLALTEGIGECIARRPREVDAAIEGPYIIYNPDTDYYYLFVSYASLKSDYNIRVGRSKNPTGPFYDYNGRDMRDVEDYTNSVGYMIACGYQFDGTQAYMGPGHNSVLRDFDNEWYLVSHIRQKNFKGGEPSTMHVRKIVWSNDGWPLASPMEYAGEKVVDLADECEVYGEYEYIKLNPTIPQGINHSVKLELNEDHSAIIADSIVGHWEIAETNRITVSYGKCVTEFVAMPAWDYELMQATLILTGKDKQGICAWCKKKVD